MANLGIKHYVENEGDLWEDAEDVVVSGGPGVGTAAACMLVALEQALLLPPSATKLWNTGAGSCVLLRLPPTPHVPTCSQDTVKRQLPGLGK